MSKNQNLSFFEKYSQYSVTKILIALPLTLFSLAKSQVFLQNFMLEIFRKIGYIVRTIKMTTRYCD